MALRELTWLLDFKDNASSGIRKVNDTLNKSTANFKKVGSSMQELSKDMEKVGKSMSLKVTAPITAIGAKAIHSVANFDDGMSKIRALTGATGDDFDKLREKAIQLGNDTAFSAQDATEGMQVLASAGRDVNEILDMSGDMFDLMSAAAIGPDTAASVLNNTMAQFNLTSKESKRIADTFAKGRASSAADVENLEYIMSQAGGTLSSMNMDIEQSVAAAGHLANAGMSVGKIGTALTSLSRDIKANAKDFKKLGINVYDPTTGKLKDMGSVMSEVEKKVGGMTDAQRDATLATIFSGESMKGAIDWINMGADSYQELTDSIYDADGITKKMAEEAEDNIGGAFRSLASSIGTLMINIGDVLKEPVKAVAEFIKNLAKKFNKLSPEFQKMIVYTGGIAAAIGPVLLSGSKLLAGIIKLLSWINPFKVAMFAAVGALLYLWKTNEDFRRAIIRMWNNLKLVLETTVQAMISFWDNFGERIIAIVMSIWDIFSSFTNMIVQIISSAVGIIAGIITGDWAGVWENAGGIVEAFIQWLSDTPKRLLEIGKNMVGALKDGITAAGGWALGKITGVFSGGADGSHKTGLGRVPFDGYKAILHKDEEVLTADDPRNINNASNTLSRPNSNNLSTQSTNFNPTININVAGNADQNTVKDIESVVNKQLDLFFRKANLQRA